MHLSFQKPMFLKIEGRSFVNTPYLQIEKCLSSFVQIWIVVKSLKLSIFRPCPIKDIRATAYYIRATAYVSLTCVRTQEVSHTSLCMQYEADHVNSYHSFLYRRVHNPKCCHKVQHSISKHLHQSLQEKSVFMGSIIIIAALIHALVSCPHFISFKCSLIYVVLYVIYVVLYVI